MYIKQTNQLNRDVLQLAAVGLLPDFQICSHLGVFHLLKDPRRPLHFARCAFGIEVVRRSEGARCRGYRPLSSFQSCTSNVLSQGAVCVSGKHAFTEIGFIASCSEVTEMISQRSISAEREYEITPFTFAFNFFTELITKR